MKVVERVSVGVSQINKNLAFFLLFLLIGLPFPALLRRLLAKFRLPIDMWRMSDMNLNHKLQ